MKFKFEMLQKVYTMDGNRIRRLKVVGRIGTEILDKPLCSTSNAYHLNDSDGGEWKSIPESELSATKQQLFDKLGETCK